MQRWESACGGRGLVFVLAEFFKLFEAADVLGEFFKFVNVFGSLEYTQTKILGVVIFWGGNGALAGIRDSTLRAFRGSR